MICAFIDFGSIFFTKWVLINCWIYPFGDGTSDCRFAFATRKHDRFKPDGRTDQSGPLFHRSSQYGQTLTGAQLGVVRTGFGMD